MAGRSRSRPCTTCWPARSSSSSSRSAITARFHLTGAREHNLAGVELEVEPFTWTAVCGPSGSGKSTLVFDTLVREGEARFLGSLSPRARAFFGKLGRGKFDSLTGLPPAIAIGAAATTSNPRSTVGTQTGCLDLLRLVFAREATDPGGEVLTRSHFSFNHPLGQCRACRGLGLEDRVDPALIVADPTKSLRTGALVPTLKNGYTVYSQVTLEVMDQIAHAHGFDVDTPWQALSDEQRDVVLFGTKALKVPFGKHSIESRLKWEGITARPREEGYYKGLVPVIEETLKRNRNENILRFVRSVPCSVCAGTRLARAGREARLGATRLPELTRTPVAALDAKLAQLPRGPVWVASEAALGARLERLQRLGLGHLALDRTSGSLSGGEAQRVRLAAQAGADLCGLLYALDEPTLGLHPESQAGMAAVLDELVERGNTLVVVEHDPDMVRRADRVVELGPGAGSEGGRIVAAEALADEPRTTRASDPLGTAPRAKSKPRRGSGRLRLTGARLHNLRAANLELRLGAFNVLMGPSGAGKSSLLFGTLLPALERKPGGAFERLEWLDAPNKTRFEAADARPIGKTPRSTPATWCGLFDLVRKRFAATDSARALGLTASHFSFNNKHARCKLCEGLGVTRIGLHLFEDVELVCEACGGARFEGELLDVRLASTDGAERNVAEVLELTFAEAQQFFCGDAEATRLTSAMLQLGLGYLKLGQSSASLSRGEAQRIKLGTLLGSKRRAASLVLLDEPDRGLAPSDVEALLAALDALVDAGHTVAAISHHRHVWAAADQLIEVRDGRTKHGASFDPNPLGARRAARAPTPPPAQLELRGVTTANLESIDVDFPRGQLTVVHGVSGSGKTSLVFGTLAAEATRRFAESLPFQVRRFMRRLPRPALSSARGLTPTLCLRQAAGPVGTRSTVATLTEIGPLLRLLFARAGQLDGQPCGLTASHFSTERAVGACPECAGRGARLRCDPARLVTHPERPLLAPKGAGALAGARAGRFFTETDGKHMATLLTAAKLCAPSDTASASKVPTDENPPAAHHLECSPTSSWHAQLHETPWRELPESLRELALFGSGDTRLEVSWQLAGKAEGKLAHDFEGTWDGLCALVEREAKVRARSKRAAEWAAPLGEVDCPTCAGTGLRDDARRTTLNGTTLPELLALPLALHVPNQVQLHHPQPERLHSEGVLAGGGAAEPGSVHATDVLAALGPELRMRLDELVALGLGHLALGRRSDTLSSGELQRVRLAGVLRSGLSGITLAIDEPAAGLHERDVARLIERLRAFGSEGNTVVLVSHRPSVQAAADHLIELGPGAGEAGGQLVSVTSRSQSCQEERVSPSREQNFDPHRELQSLAQPKIVAAPRLAITGAHAHNLRNIDVELPATGLVAVTGVSGSGKSSLVFDVIKASVLARRPIGCRTFELPHTFEAVIDARGHTQPSQCALEALGIASDVAALFADSELPAAAFKLKSPKGRCPTCHGTGRERIAMDFSADLELACPTCAGRRFRPEVLAATFHGRSIDELLSAPAQQLAATLTQHDLGSKKLRGALAALAEVAADHIPLGRPRRELSGGEAARLTLAPSLQTEASPALYLFDEPARGLAESDLAQVIRAFRRLTARGDLVLATEHRLSLIAAADWVVDLGPEGGPEGGQLIAAGPPDQLASGHTAAALRARRQA